MQRKLIDLQSVGPRTVEDFEVLGVYHVEQLVNQDAHRLYVRLCTLTNKRHDPCVEDVFRCAIEQAKHPHLSEEKKKWHYWSRIRKAKR